MATYKVSLHAATKVAFVSSVVEPTPNGSIMLGTVHLDGPNPKYDPINMAVLYEHVRKLVAKQANRSPFLPKIVLLENSHDSEKTAYELASKEGFNGTLVEWLESLRGEPGLPGETAYFTFTQSSPLASWVVNHNFGYLPSSVSVLSPGGQEVEAGVVHNNVNQLTIQFAGPYSGTANIV